MTVSSPASTPVPAGQPACGSLFAPGRRAASLGAVALISMLAFEAIAVATAMPAVAQGLNGLGLYALAFGVTLATSLPGMVAAGELCDKRGPYPATLGGLALFLAGLLLAGLAQTMAQLVAGRALQGLGAGMLGVSLYVGVARVIPAALHPRLFALFAAAWVLPGLLGPALASALVQRLGWRAVFLAVAAAVPLAAAAMLPALRSTRSGSRSAMRWQRLGWALLASAGVLLLHAASQQSQRLAQGGLFLPGLLAAGLAASRLLPEGSLRAGCGLPSVILLRGLIAAAFACAEAFVPLLLTAHFDWSLGEAGMALSAGAVTWSLGSAVQARVRQHAWRRRLLTAGFTLAAGGLLGVASPVLLHWPAAWVLAGWAATGLGIGMSFPMLSVLMLKLSPPDRQGANSSALQLSDALTSSVALALAGLLFDPATRQVLPVLALAGALAALAAWLSPRAWNQPG